MHIQCKQTCHRDTYGHIWCRPTAITTIFNFPQVENKYLITYNPLEQKLCVVHLLDIRRQIIGFDRTEKGIHIDETDNTTKHDKIRC